MSSPCRCAVAITASSIAVVMKRHGEKRLVSIRSSPLGHYGWRPHPLPISADEPGDEGLASITAVGFNQRIAAPDRPVSKYWTGCGHL